MNFISTHTTHSQTLSIFLCCALTSGPRGAGSSEVVSRNSDAIDPSRDNYVHSKNECDFALAMWECFFILLVSCYTLWMTLGSVSRRLLTPQEKRWCVWYSCSCSKVIDLLGLCLLHIGNVNRAPRSLALKMARRAVQCKGIQEIESTSIACRGFFGGRFSDPGLGNLCFPLSLVSTIPSTVGMLFAITRTVCPSAGNGGSLATSGCGGIVG